MCFENGCRGLLLSSTRGCRAIAECRIILPATPNYSSKLILAAGSLAIGLEAFISPEIPEITM
jgi:hypothetical protein